MKRYQCHVSPSPWRNFHIDKSWTWMRHLPVTHQNLHGMTRFGQELHSSARMRPSIAPVQIAGPWLWSVSLILTSMEVTRALLRAKRSRSVKFIRSNDGRFNYTWYCEPWASACYHGTEVFIYAYRHHHTAVELRSSPCSSQMFAHPDEKIRYTNLNHEIFQSMKWANSSVVSFDKRPSSGTGNSQGDWSMSCDLPACAFCYDEQPGKYQSRMEFPSFSQSEMSKKCRLNRSALLLWGRAKSLSVEYTDFAWNAIAHSLDFARSGMMLFCLERFY